MSDHGIDWANLPNEHRAAVGMLADENYRLRAEVARMRPVVDAAVAVAVATEEAGTKLFWSVGGATRARDNLDAALAAYRAGVGS